MGFRCPKCNKEFGKDKASFERHRNVCCREITDDFILENSEEITTVVLLKNLKEIAKETLKKQKRENSDEF